MTDTRRTLQGLSEIAAFLGLPETFNRSSLRRWVDLEKMPAFQVAGRWWADPDDLDAWWTARKRRLQPRRAG